MHIDRVQLENMGVHLLRAVQHPATEPKLAGIGYALAGVLICIALLALVIGLSPRKRTVKKVIRYWVPDGEEPPAELLQPAPPAPQPAEGPAEDEATASTVPVKRGPFASAKAFLGALLVPALVLGALAAVYVETSSDRSCVACHNGRSTAIALATDKHAACSDCHSRPLPLGIVGNTADRVRMGVAKVRGTGNVTREAVDSVSCLKCHKQELKGTIRSKKVPVLMKHAEPLAAGMSCTECHGDVGHREKRQTVSMSRCLQCHDGKRASAKCSTCHLTDVGRTGEIAKLNGDQPTGRLSYPPVRIGDIDCGGCHQVKTECTTCHKVTMPHSKRFLAGYHAKEAAFDKKQVCWRCHQETDCSGCHRVPFKGGHTPTWKTDHTKAPRNAGCACHMGDNKNEAKSMCDYCHTPVKGSSASKAGVTSASTATSAPPLR